MKALTAIFDTKHRGVTFDCVYYYILADIYRELKGYDHLRIVIQQEELRRKTEREYIYTEDEKYWRIHNIVAMAPRLLESVISIELTRIPSTTVPVSVFPPGYHPLYPHPEAKRVFNLMDIMSIVRGRNHLIPRLKAPSHAVKIAMNRTRGERFVTITLRKSTFQPERNSNLEAWEKFATHLASTGLSVHFIPDPETFQHPKVGVDTRFSYLLDAAADLQLRMAYYELAEHNYCVSNGPAALLYLSRVPFSMFGIMREGTNNCGAKFIHQNCGVKHGEKFPWLNEQQYISWELDGFEAIMNHYAVISRVDGNPPLFSGARK